MPFLKINQTVAKDQRTQNRNTGSEANSGLTRKIDKLTIQNLRLCSGQCTFFIVHSCAECTIELAKRVADTY